VQHRFADSDPHEGIVVRHERVRLGDQLAESGKYCAFRGCVVRDCDVADRRKPEGGEPVLKTRSR